MGKRNCISAGGCISRIFKSNCWSPSSPDSLNEDGGRFLAFPSSLEASDEDEMGRREPGGMGRCLFCVSCYISDLRVFY